MTRLQDTAWSYSRITTFTQCPQAYKLKYIDGVPDDTNAFAQYGSMCHDLLERWAKRELLSFELESEYQAQFDPRVSRSFPPFPRGLGQKYFEQGLRYFANFDGFGANLDAVTVEERFVTMVGGHKLTGIVDLLLRDRENGAQILVDHKSASSKTMRKSLDEKTRQLYLYALFVREAHGAHPALLRFNLFRENMVLDAPFDSARLQETTDWFSSTVEQILRETQWQPRKQDYFCRHICGVNMDCPIGQELLRKAGSHAELPQAFPHQQHHLA